MRHLAILVLLYLLALSLLFVALASLPKWRQMQPKEKKRANTVMISKEDMLPGWGLEEEP